SDRATTLSRCGDLASVAARRTSGAVGDQPESDAVARGVRTVSRAAAAVAVAGAAVVADMDRDGPGRVATLARCNLSRPVIGRAAAAHGRAPPCSRYQFRAGRRRSGTVNQPAAGRLAAQPRGSCTSALGPLEGADVGEQILEVVPGHLVEVEG